MNSNYFLLCLVGSMALMSMAMATEKKDNEKVENSTESPIADMAVFDTEMKTSTEKLLVAAAAPSAEESMMETDKKDEKKDGKETAQRHTVADFIIHPLIAFKPRNPEDENVAGKQSDSSSTTTPSPWQLFGFNAGQGLGSSVSSLAGSVTGWINDRIQIPGFVETPVRETTSTSTTTTTTPRPDVVVRVQHRPSTRKPLISISNRNRPNRFNTNNNNNNLNNFDSDEDDDDYYENNSGFSNVNSNRNRHKNDDVDDDFDGVDDDQDDNGTEEYEDDQSSEDDESGEENDDDEDDHQQASQRPNNRRRPVQQNERRRQQLNRRMPQRNSYGTQRQQSSNNNVEEDEEENNFYYGPRQSTKRSQSQTNFIQRGQQGILNQIRQLTQGQTPAEIGAAMRRSQQGSNKRRKQATLLINRNGQTIYVAPELLNSNMQAANNPQYQYYAAPVNKPMSVSPYPQPPLTVPLKRKGRPTQYITIPWSQLGIAPPDQLISITEGVQSQPLILNIPQSAVNTIQSPNRKKRPVITPDAVPLLAEASLMDVFKPPRIPPSRHTGSSSLIVASKTKPSAKRKSASILPHRIRSGTIVEKAPAALDTANEESDEQSVASAVQADDEIRKSDNDFIIVGEDNEPGLTRNVQPVHGDARYVYGGIRPYYRRVALRNGGRALEQSENVSVVKTQVGDANERQIPVQIVTDDKIPQQEQQPLLEVQPHADANEPTVHAATAATPAETPVEETIKSNVETVVA